MLLQINYDGAVHAVVELFTGAHGIVEFRGSTLYEEKMQKLNDNAYPYSCIRDRFQTRCNSGDHDNDDNTEHPTSVDTLFW